MTVQPAWALIDGHGKTVASVRAPTAYLARAEFKRAGQVGVRVVRATVAPVDENATPTGPVCENESCRRPIAEERDYRLVTGWERISRSAGGTNAIRAPDRSAERFMCMFCVGKLADGVALGQQTLV